MDKTNEAMEKATEAYQPINVDYFLAMEVANGGPSKQLVTLDGSLKTVRDIVNHWKAHPYYRSFGEQMQPEISQYYNCMLGGFRKGVENHHDIGWDKLTREYYYSKEEMSDEEIEEYLRENPVEFENGFIKHSYHRAFAMIGRLIEGKPYIPFYMKSDQIYMNPRATDQKHRAKPLTQRVKLLDKMDSSRIPRSEYCICQSGLLALMGIRENSDLDIIISSKLREQPISFPTGVEIFSKDRKKFDYFGADGDDDIIENYCITIDGYKFLEPRFYFARKFLANRARDVDDWKAINRFFSRGLHKGFPFNFEEYKWGLPKQLAEKVEMKEIDFKNAKIIIDKYDRIVGGVNQGRMVYELADFYVKIFHPNYCRLKNFKRALDLQLYNGIAPSLTHLVYDNGSLRGYIMRKGTVINDGERTDDIPESFVRSVVRNCKQRGMVYYDLIARNVIRDDYTGQYSLIDLESAYDLDDLDTMHDHNATIKPPNLLDMIKNI